MSRLLPEAPEYVSAESRGTRGQSMNVVKETRNQCKQRFRNEIKHKWIKNPLHGQYMREAHREQMHQSLTWNRLKIGGIKGKTEALITTRQDQALATKYYKSKILGISNDPKYRLCKKYNETLQHIVSGCPILAAKEYLDRHNSVASHLHWKICRHFNIPTHDKWYLHQPKPVVDTPEVTIIMNHRIITSLRKKPKR
ncbi:unnamed protein product [Acanthoscelides obtectus]|uniref:Uncharacterized protein n=1 Tax=Acanthoscelides obtectus TaxID=200917 RepID=A0A9P0PS97_ACAOB|nr:unnamed protein product [Acanthoscelides obtectus]CAK1641830.1 hypothetical protein AOBTE_LOCUS12664 [Acanthoscelides obtectus]